MDVIRDKYARGQVVAAAEQYACLCDIIRSPTEHTKDDVRFLIERTLCPVEQSFDASWEEGNDALCIAIKQRTFPGQLAVVRMLVCAGAQVDAARRCANMRFENLWELITDPASLPIDG